MDAAFAQVCSIFERIVLEECNFFMNSPLSLIKALFIFAREFTFCTSLSVCGDGDDACHCSWDSNVWVKPIEAQASLSCSGSTFETSFISENSQLLKVTLRVKTAPIMSHSNCKITLSGLSNPKTTDVGKIESKITRVSPTNSTPFSAVSDIQPLLQNGIISQDSIVFSSNLPAAEKSCLASSPLSQCNGHGE